MRKILATVSGCLMFFGDIAPSSAQSWSAPLTITSYSVQDNRLGLVVTGGTNPLHCAPATTWYFVYNTDPNFALVASTLLTAYLQKRPVVVYEVSCDPDGAVHFRGAMLSG